MQKMACSHYETLNQRFKQWGYRSQTRHHDLRDYRNAVYMIGIIFQLCISNGTGYFEVYYNGCNPCAKQDLVKCAEDAWYGLCEGYKSFYVYNIHHMGSEEDFCFFPFF